jgi:hypothetical protein
MNDTESTYMYIGNPILGIFFQQSPPTYFTCKATYIHRYINLLSCSSYSNLPISFFNNSRLKEDHRIGPKS